MYNLPIRTLILCVVLPPFVYVFFLFSLEKSIQSRYDWDLSATYLGDTRLLFDGSARLQDVLGENIDAFMAGKRLIDWGVRVVVTVKTKVGDYLYPGAYSELRTDFGGEDSVMVARDNYEMLNKGLVLHIDVKIDHNTLIANIVLVMCIGASLTLLFLVYRRGLLKSRQAERETRNVIDSLAVEKQKSLDRLSRIEAQREKLSQNTLFLQNDLEQQRRLASDTEEQMIDEMVALEEQIKEHLKQQESQLQEIDVLKEKIARSEKEHDIRRKQQTKAENGVRKRFNTLYKNLALHDRAIEGFIDLTEEMKIKAEEVIHQLNADSRKVPIKRKVFGKKNRETVFEVIFSYKGRLYYKKLPDRRSEILAIGTKLTQSGDLAFLNKR